jgi:hypothetical protein
MPKNHKSWSLLLPYSLALAIAVTTGAGPASAQGPAEGFSLGLAGGFSRGPSSPFNSSRIGYHALATLEFPSPVPRFRLRTDALFADWGGGHVSALTANVLVTPISGRRVAPYVLAGGGAYTTGGSEVRAGWTLGAGLRLPGDMHSITIESRLHTFRAGWRNSLPPYAVEPGWRAVWTPLGLGIQF